MPDSFGLMTIEGKVSYVNKIPFDIGKVTANIQGAGGIFRVKFAFKESKLCCSGVTSCLRASSVRMGLHTELRR